MKPRAERVSQQMKRRLKKSRKNPRIDGLNIYKGRGQQGQQLIPVGASTSTLEIVDRNPAAQPVEVTGIVETDRIEGPFINPAQLLSLLQRAVGVHKALGKAIHNAKAIRAERKEKTDK